MKINVNAKPNSKHLKAVWTGSRLNIHLTAPAKDGKANEQLVRSLADLFGVSKKLILILSGHSHKNKLVSIKITRREFNSVVSSIHEK